MATEPLYNPNDGLVGRDGGPYLDEEEARLAETRRARVENREPDYDNPGATAGIPLTTAAQLIHNLDVQAGSSRNRNPLGVSPDKARELYKDSADSDDNNLRIMDEVNLDEVKRLSEENAEKEVQGSDFNENDPNAPVDDTGTTSGSNSGSTLGFTPDDDFSFDDDESKAPAKKAAAKKAAPSSKK